MDQAVIISMALAFFAYCFNNIPYPFDMVTDSARGEENHKDIIDDYQIGFPTTPAPWSYGLAIGKIHPLISTVFLVFL